MAAFWQTAEHARSDLRRLDCFLLLLVPAMFTATPGRTLISTKSAATPAMQWRDIASEIVWPARSQLMCQADLAFCFKHHPAPTGRVRMMLTSVPDERSWQDILAMAQCAFATRHTGRAGGLMKTSIKQSITRCRFKQWQQLRRSDIACLVPS